MKIASWNVNSLNVRLPHLEQWLGAVRAGHRRAAGDQARRRPLPRRPRWSRRATAACSAGQKTYNGVAILSRESARDVQVGVPGFEDEQKRVIAATVGELRIVNLYVVNGQDVGTDKYDYKLRWLEAVHDWLARGAAQAPPTWSCWATSTSPRTSATCTTRCCGTRHTSSPPPPSVRR